MPLARPADAESLPDPWLIPMSEVCRRLGGISRRTLFDLVRKKGLPSFQLGTRVMFRPVEIEAWILDQQKAGNSGLKIHDGPQEVATSTN